MPNGIVVVVGVGVGVVVVVVVVVVVGVVVVAVAKGLQLIWKIYERMEWDLRHDCHTIQI